MQPLFSSIPEGRIVVGRGCSLEALVRSILDQAAADAADSANGFPHDLIAVVEPGEDLKPLLLGHDQPQAAVDLP